MLIQQRATVEDTDLQDAEEGALHVCHLILDIAIERKNVAGLLDKLKLRRG